MQEPRAYVTLIISRKFQVIRTMSKLLCLLSIILLLAYFSKAEEEKEKIDEPPIDQDLPLVLINTSEKEGELLPTEVEMKLKNTGFFEKKKIIQFSIWFYLDQGFYCPPENDAQKLKIAYAINKQNEAKGSMKEEIDDRCLIKKQPSDAIPAPQCQKQPQPKIMKVFSGNKVASKENNKVFSTSGEISCGPEGVGKVLGFGYQVCIEYEGWGKIWKLFQRNTEVHPLKNTKEVLFYNLCYSAKTSEILYTFNTITGSELFTNPLLEKDRKKIWPMGMYNSIHIPNIEFEQVKLQLKQVEEISDFRIQELVHPEDFAMGLWKKPAYHYVNAGLIHKDLQQCWNNMHVKIQEHIWKIPKYLGWNYIDILTGAFKLSEIGDPIMINDVEIPKMWVKILKDVYTVAIIANNLRDEAVDKIITEKYNCIENLCEKFLEENCPDVLNNIRCCPLTDEIQSLFGTKIKSLGIRRIEGLVRVKKDEQDKSRPPEPYKELPYHPGGYSWAGRWATMSTA